MNEFIYFIALGFLLYFIGLFVSGIILCIIDGIKAIFSKNFWKENILGIGVLIFTFSLPSILIHFNI